MKIERGMRDCLEKQWADSTNHLRMLALHTTHIIATLHSHLNPGRQEPDCECKPETERCMFLRCECVLRYRISPSGVRPGEYNSQAMSASAVESPLRLHPEPNLAVFIKRAIHISHSIAAKLPQAEGELGCATEVPSRHRLRL